MSQNKTKAPETPAEAQEQKREEAAAAATIKAKVVAKKGDLSVAVNRIVQTGDDGHPQEIAPGDLFYPAEVDVEFLTKNEAIRVPTETEKLAHEFVERTRAAADTTDETLG